MFHVKRVTYETRNMPKVFTSEKQKIGEIGENVAVKFLVRHDFTILDRNYTKRWGEIDIIAERNNKIYFIEVKSVSHDLSADKEETNSSRPEENMHPWKIRRLARTIQTYILSKNLEKEWQVDLLVVSLNIKDKTAKVRVVKNIIL